MMLFHLNSLKVFFFMDWEMINNNDFSRNRNVPIFVLALSIYSHYQYDSYYFIKFALALKTLLLKLKFPHIWNQMIYCNNFFKRKITKILSIFGNSNLKINLYFLGHGKSLIFHDHICLKDYISYHTWPILKRVKYFLMSLVLQYGN